MRTYITCFFIIMAISLFTGCNSDKQNNDNHSSENKHENAGASGHSHEGHDHDGDSHEGHDHEGHNHEGHDHEGHNHEGDDHEGHDHEGHNHEGHNHEGHDHDGHSDEIIFSKKQAELVGLTVETASPGTFSHVLKTSGHVMAAQGDEAVIAATSNGIVSFINPSISDGATIRSGEAIVTISAKKILEGDPAAKAKFEFETVQKEMQRAESLIKDQIISVKDYEQVKLRYETAKSAYEAHASTITENGVKVTSPINGFIKNRLVGQGEYVSVGQPIATVSQNKRLQLVAEVSENHYKFLKNISSANFKPAYDDVVYKLSDLNGRLLSYGKTSGQQSFYIPVTFEFDNVGDIIPGSFTEVFLLTNPLNNVFSTPVSAITEEQGLNFIYLKISEEEYKKQEVTLGHNNGERVQILSGLKTGDKVVTKGVYQVKLAAISSVIPDGHSHSH